VNKGGGTIAITAHIGRAAKLRQESINQGVANKMLATASDIGMLLQIKRIQLFKSMKPFDLHRHILAPQCALIFLDAAGVI
jgi:hypothetical protein